MQNIRSGNMLVRNMKFEIRRSIKWLYSQYPYGNMPERIKRKITDAEAFFILLDQYPYNKCETLHILLERMKKDRNAMKEELVIKDVYSYGHQFSMFDELQEPKEEEMKAKEKEIEHLKYQIDFLHKCMGIAKNRLYFT